MLTERSFPHDPKHAYKLAAWMFEFHWHVFFGEPQTAKWLYTNDICGEEWSSTPLLMTCCKDELRQDFFEFVESPPMSRKAHGETNEM